MANTIFQRQNQEEILKCLVVQRRLYSVVKRLQIVPTAAVVMSVVVPFIFEKSVDGCSNGEWMLASIAVLAWIFTAIFGVYRDYTKSLAAGFQQYVDCKLFAGTLGKHCEFCGVPLPSEIACKISKISQRDIEREKVRNWYSDYSLFSEQYAVLCCQMENVRWDQALRLILLVVLVCLGVAWIAWLVVRNFDISLRCLLPTLSWCASGLVVVPRLCLALIRDVQRIGKIRGCLAQAEMEILQGVDASVKLTQIQGLIFEHRKDALLVPDVIYKSSRKIFQCAEDATAKSHREMLS